MKTDLIGGSYTQRYPAFNSERTINWYPTKSSNDEKNKNQTALMATPGLTQFVNLPGRYSRGICVARIPSSTRCFAVVDNILYEVFTNKSYISRGTMSSMNIGPSTVDFIVNSVGQLGIFHQSASYCLTLANNTLSQITTNQFVGQVSSADYMEGYTFVTSQGAVYTTLNDLTVWNNLNTFTPTFTAAPAIAVKTLIQQPYIFTTRTIEPFVSDATVSPPFSAYPRLVIHVGLVSKDSLFKFQDGFLFVGRAESGECAIYAYDKFFQCVQVSPFSITWQINQVKNTLAECYANGYATKDGHIWYQLTIPSLKTTYVFDYTTKEWFERQSLQPSNDSNGDNVYREFRGKHYADFNGLNLWQDIYSGNIYQEDYTNQTEDNNTIIRTRISSTIDNERQIMEIHSLELDTNCGYGTLSGQGSTPYIMVSWSNNGGFNYNDPELAPLGTQGDYTNRTRINQLGANRLWTFKLTLSDPVDSMIQNAYIHGSLGDET